VTSEDTSNILQGTAGGNARVIGAIAPHPSGYAYARPVAGQQ